MKHFSVRFIPKAALPLRLGSVLCASLLFSVSASGQELDGGAEDLNSLLVAIRETDPAIEAARLRWEAVQDVVPTTGALPDPTITYGYFFSSIETRLGPMNQRVGVAQRMPWPTKLWAEREVGERQAETVYWQYLHTLRKRVTMGKKAFAELAFVDAQIEILRQQRTLSAEMVESVRAGFETSRHDLSDLLLTRQRVGDLEAKLAEAKGDREAARATLNRLSGAPFSTEIPEADFYPVAELPSSDEILEYAAANSELLQAEAAAVVLARERLALAEKQDLPDITFGVDYTEIGRQGMSGISDNGRDAFMGYVSLNVPIWRDKYDAVEQAARRRLSMARASERAARRDIAAELLRQLAQAASIVEQIEIHKAELLPQAKAAHESTVSAFAAGRASSVKWIEAQQNLLDTRLRLARLQGNYRQSVAELELISGIDFRIPERSRE